MIIPAVYKKFTRQLGWGVYACRTIPAGTIIMTECSYCRKLTHEDASRHPQKEFIFSHAPITSSTYPDFMIPCREEIYFVNHSCTANILPVGDGMDVLVDTVYDNEAFSYDYRFMFDPYIDFQCDCGKKNCVKRVRCFDVSESLFAQWQDRVGKILPLIPQLPQPLLKNKIDFEAIFFNELVIQRTKLDSRFDHLQN